MTKMSIVTPEISSDKGGIQNWMFFTKLLLQSNDYNVEHYAYKEDGFLPWFRLINKDIYLLATWKMIFFIFPFIAISSGKKVIVFVHGNEFLNLKSFHNIVIGFLAKRKNTYFIANSTAIADLFEDRTKRKVDFIQPPFMDIPKVDADNNIISDNCIEFLTLTRLVNRKNVKSVILALSKIHKENKQFNFKYYIAGIGPEMNTLKKLVNDLGLVNKVFFLGKVDNKRKFELYSNCNFFLLPSLYDKINGSIEGYGIVYIEANTFGKPVLSGNTGGMTEAVIDGVTGLHCDGSVDDIYSKILLLLASRFDSVVINKHAQNHHYVSQKDFIDFICAISPESA
ncbi:glycosyltransferase family 4 protein [Vibrio sp. Isolate31]|uniref:glycosyltransferase family 4 protein n=1 Tax=Vibrio sp. Isolate31 TaxID=2908537 RepID=UPI001EFDB378|nr:glycosyltransferase family 4 protein [Vibrio sp. Isolate31]MCG9603289.1 glycosyltransferase family 4 protein [Vibrio sp. Isolate31]